MRVIRVPKVTRKAFNKNRPASDLLRRQVAQLEHVVEVTRGAGPVTLSARKVKTEGQAAQFIAAATRALNVETVSPVPKPPPMPTPSPRPTKGAARKATVATRQRKPKVAKKTARKGSKR